MERLSAEEAKERIISRGFLNHVTVAGEVDLSRKEFETLDLAGTTIEGDLVLIGVQVNKLYLICATVKGSVHLDGADIESANLRGITITDTLYRGGIDERKLFIDKGVSIKSIV